MNLPESRRIGSRLPESRRIGSRLPESRRIGSRLADSVAVSLNLLESSGFSSQLGDGSETELECKGAGDNRRLIEMACEPYLTRPTAEKVVIMRDRCRLVDSVVDSLNLGDSSGIGSRLPEIGSRLPESRRIGSQLVDSVVDSLNLGDSSGFCSQLVDFVESTKIQIKTRDHL